MIDPCDPDIEYASSRTFKLQFDCGSVYTILDDLREEPLRCFLKKGHTGLCPQALLEAVGRLVTIIFQSTDVPMRQIYLTLKGINCDAGSPFVCGVSCMDGLASKIKERWPDLVELDESCLEPKAQEEEDDEEELCAPTD